MFYSEHTVVCSDCTCLDTNWNMLFEIQRNVHKWFLCVRRNESEWDEKKNDGCGTSNKLFGYWAGFGEPKKQMSSMMSWLFFFACSSCSCHCRRRLLYHPHYTDDCIYLLRVAFASSFQTVEQHELPVQAATERTKGPRWYMIRSLTLVYIYKSCISRCLYGSISHRDLSFSLHSPLYLSMQLGITERRAFVCVFASFSFFRV